MGAIGRRNTSNLSEQMRECSMAPCVHACLCFASWRGISRSPTSVRCLCAGRAAGACSGVAALIHVAGVGMFPVPGTVFGPLSGIFIWLVLDDVVFAVTAAALAATGIRFPVPVALAAFLWKEWRSRRAASAVAEGGDVDIDVDGDEGDAANDEAAAAAERRAAYRDGLRQRRGQRDRRRPAPAGHADDAASRPQQRMSRRQARAAERDQTRANRAARKAGGRRPATDVRRAAREAVEKSRRQQAARKGGKAATPSRGGGTSSGASTATKSQPRQQQRRAAANVGGAGEQDVLDGPDVGFEIPSDCDEDVVVSPSRGLAITKQSPNDFRLLAQQ